MRIDRRAFFGAVRGPLYGGRLSRGQVAGMTALLDRFERDGRTADRRFLAYMLATAHHETGGRMRPVRETFAATDHYRLMAEAFAAAVLTGAPVPYPPADSVENMRVLDAIARASRSGKVEDV